LPNDLARRWAALTPEAIQKVAPEQEEAVA